MYAQFAVMFMIRKQAIRIMALLRARSGKMSRLIGYVPFAVRTNPLLKRNKPQAVFRT
ncbi:hypothetical protein HMPREF3293_02959 [Christensenella minuta]|uniref:Uncharacterized protein n=1 Tax=Christensenella minuta TaxID=626937 RepID=A0A136Q139_9FIRM|nr:hypothetical protein HMPREF3293_02959 [Christensenella minuta]